MLIVVVDHQHLGHGNAFILIAFLLNRDTVVWRMLHHARPVHAAGDRTL